MVTLEICDASGIMMITNNWPEICDAYTFIKENRFTRVPFKWQEGFGAFSYADSQLDIVIKYILNQKEHHKKKTFREEYLIFLLKYKVDFNPRYLFEWNE